MSVKYYFDDPEGAGPSPETSHPAFVAHFKHAYYYDCVDEQAPFGSDEGADLLYNLEDRFRDLGAPKSILDWLFDTIDGYGFKYRSREPAYFTDEEQLAKLDEEDEYFVDQMDLAIIAAAFGQIKISGAIETGMKELALLALQRRRGRIARLTASSEWVERLDEMAGDLRLFGA